MDSMSQFIEMLFKKPITGKIGDLVDKKIFSVKKIHSMNDIIEYIDISSVERSNHSIVETTSYVVSNAPSRAQQCVRLDDILVSTVRPINRNIAVVNSDKNNLVASTGFCVLRPKLAFKEYLLAIVQSDKYTEAMIDKASGGLYPAVNNGDVLNYGIYIPDEEFAKKFSLIYQQADKSKFGDFKSQFIEMFGDPLSPIQKWPIVRLGDYCIVNPTKPKGISDEMEVSFIPMQDVSDDGSCNKFINRPYAEVKKGFTYCADGDVIFAKITPCMENGKGAELQGLTNAIGMGSTEFHVLRPISGKSISTWLYHFTKLDIIRKDAAKNMTGTGGQKRVPASYFDNFKIGVPSIDEQMNFAALANQADKSKSYVRIALKNLESILGYCIRQVA